MRSSSSRTRVTPRRSPRAAGRTRPSELSGRPLAVPFAVAFGLLMAAEVLYLGYLLWKPDPSLDWYLIVPVLLAAAAVTGALLVLRGRARAWMVLAGAAVVPLVGLLVLVFILGALGATAEMWSAVLLTTGPLGCLVLAVRRPVREWTSPGRPTRSPGKRRGGRGDR